MPKISTQTIVVRHKDIDKKYEIIVNYNQRQHFYAILPSEFGDIVHHLSKEEQRKLFIENLQIGKYKADRVKYVIPAESEDECIKLINNCLKELIGRTITQRNVIIVFYNPRDNVNYNDHRYNNEHPQIGLQFGLTYAVETTTGDKKIYSQYWEHEAFGEKFTERKELNLYNKASIIIPDTPENRVFLNQLYDKLKTLNEKLKEFTGSPEKMTELIASGLKMLNA